MRPPFRNPDAVHPVAVLLGVIGFGSSLAGAPVSALDFGFSTTNNERFHGVAFNNGDFGFFDSQVAPGSAGPSPGRTRCSS